MSETRPRGSRPTFQLDFDPATVTEADILRKGGVLFDAGSYWEAHEVWEQLWRKRAGRPDRDFMKGLIQGAAGTWHATQGNYKGAVSVLSRALEYLGPYHPAHDGVDVDALAAALSGVREQSRTALDGRPPPRVELRPLRIGG